MQLQAAKLVTDFDGADPRPYLLTMETPTEASGRSLTVVAGRK